MMLSACGRRWTKNRENKTLPNIQKSMCEKYLKWRTSQGVKQSTTRHGIKTLRSAINSY